MKQVIYIFLMIPICGFTQNAKFKNHLHYSYDRPPLLDSVQSIDVDLKGDFDHNFTETQITSWISKDNQLVIQEEQADVTIEFDFGSFAVDEERALTHTEKDKKGNITSTSYSYFVRGVHPVYYAVYNKEFKVIKSGKVYHHSQDHTSRQFSTLSQAQKQGRVEAWREVQNELNRKIDHSVRKTLNILVGLYQPMTITPNNNVFYGEVYYPIITFKSKRVDREGFDHAATLVKEAFANEQINEQDIQEAIVFWKKQLQTIDKTDKKRQKAYYGSAINLAHIYFVLRDFEESKKYLAIAKEQSWASWLYSHIEREHRRFEHNLASTLEE